MGSDSFAALADAYANIDIFIIVAARFIGFFVIIPVLAGANVPVNIRVVLAISITFIVISSGKVSEITYFPSFAGLTMLVVKEFFVGFLIAFSVYLVFSIVYFVGQLVDMQIGLSMANVMDPLTQIQVPILGNLLYFFISVLFVRTGGLNTFIQSVFYSYDLIPVGSASLLGNKPLIDNVLLLMAEYIVIGIQFSLPIVGTILVLDVALGLLVKASPQMNIFVVGMPIKLLVGLILLYIISPIFVNMYNVLFARSFDAAMSALRGMISG